MENEVLPPQQRLDKNSVNAWLINELTINALALIVLVLFIFISNYFSWISWIHWGLIALAILTAIDLAITPIRLKLRYKHWRFGVSEAFLQLKTGALFEKHQIIPMARIQSVSIHQGPILRRYNLYNIKINTIKAEHTIPGLHKTEAFEIRDRIANYANVEVLGE